MGMRLFLYACYLSLVRHSGAVTFHNSPTTSVNENDDGTVTLWSISVTCNPNLGALFGFSSVSCDSCVLSTNPQSGLFEMSGFNVRKRSCSDTSCGSCPSCSTCSPASGCTSSGQSYSLTVTCSTSGYFFDDSGSSSFTVSVTGESPTLAVTLSSPLSADRSMSIGTVLTTATTTAGLTIRDWAETTSVANSYLLGTTQLFALDTANGQIKVNKDPTSEYSYTYSMTICAYTRRQSNCPSTTINFDGCFQTPTCADLSSTVIDTHAIGGTLFTMSVPAPSAHFSSISPTWQGTSFAEVSSTLGVASLDTSTDPDETAPAGAVSSGSSLFTGVITTTGNITVHPHYPSQDHTIVVRIMNSASCFYNTTCTMSLTATFTNWDIEIINNVTSTAIHEDVDARTTIFSIITFDGNDPAQDNVTCTLTTNPDTTLFEIVQDGAHDFDSFDIVKKVCTDPGCGFLCDLNIGCLNWNLTSSYTFVARCEDGYGSSDTETFTLTVNRNEIFIWRNLPMTITVNSDNVGHLDILFSTFYTDAENEDLFYNYSVTPSQPSPALFGFDNTGNYYNNPANVTSLIYEWDVTNITYTVFICGKERRNYKCEDLTIQIREFCGPAPTCDTDAITVSDQFTIGNTLLTINAPAPATGSFTSLSYAISTQHTDLFDVDSSTGVISSKAALPVANPPAATQYSISGLVYDTAACEYASCVLTVTVTFTNFDISIDNMASVSATIHEDTTASVTLHAITTSDANTDDTVNCTVDEANSVPANNGKFYTSETDQGSNEYVIVSRSNPGFDYDVQNSYTVAITCGDKYGSSDSASMTVTIGENQAPTMDNLDNTTVVNVDPLATFSGTPLFTLQTSDAENDALTYNCSVSDTWVPLECISDGVVSLRRNITMPNENGTIYNITLCIFEPVHSHSLCAVLQVNFTTDKTYPILDNLPAEVSFTEDTSVGSTLYDVSVQDPDVGDNHTFSIVSVSPSEAASTFSIDASNGEITLVSALDYETQNQYNFTVSVSDQDLTTLEDRVLTLNVNNTNETPVLVLYGNSFNTTEGSAGRTIGKLNFSCTDPDISETLTFALTTGTYKNYFSLDGISGVVTHAQDWDFESGAALPDWTDVIVSCSDDESLSSTATVSISIAKVNEFAPALNTIAENITIYSNHTLYIPILNVTATDADFPTDGNFTFSIAGVGNGVNYFTINSDGQLLVAQYIDWTYNFTYEFTIIVSDNDTDPRTSSVDVIVTYIAPNITIVHTKPTKCILCTTEGIVVVSSLCMEALLILTCMCHICVRMKACSISKETPLQSTSTGIPRRKQNVSDIRHQLEDWSDDDEPEIANIAEDEEPIPSKMYRPGSECMSRAIPEKGPPPVFNYYENVPTPPPPPEYHGPGMDLSELQEPVVTPSEILPVTGYEDTTVDTIMVPGRRKRKRRTRHKAELTPSITAAQLPPKRTIPQLYRDDDFPTQAITPHKAPSSASNPFFRDSNQWQPLLSLPNRDPVRLSPEFSLETDSFHRPRQQNSSRRPSHTRHLSPVWEPPGSSSPNIEFGTPWRDGRPLPASQSSRGMDF